MGRGSIRIKTKTIIVYIGFKWFFMPSLCVYTFCLNKTIIIIRLIKMFYPFLETINELFDFIFLKVKYIPNMGLNSGH